MAYRFEIDRPAASEVRRIAQEQIDRALAEIADDDLAAHETVHQVRKRCKKLRGLLRLVRDTLGDAYGVEQTRYRDVARALSDVRDAASLVECVDALAEWHTGTGDDARFAALRDALVERRRHIARSLDLDARLSDAAEALRDGRDAVASWSHGLPGGFEALRAGMRRTYRRARSARDAAYERPAPERFHEWRKRAKYHWYHVRLIADAWEPLLAGRVAELDRLSDLLGDDHDLAILRATLDAEADDHGGGASGRGVVLLIDQRRRELQAWARPLGERLFHEKPRRFTKRMENAWTCRRAELELGAVGTVGQVEAS